MITRHRDAHGVARRVDGETFSGSVISINRSPEKPAATKARSPATATSSAKSGTSERPAKWVRREPDLDNPHTPGGIRHKGVLAGDRHPVGILGVQAQVQNRVGRLADVDHVKSGTAVCHVGNIPLDDHVASDTRCVDPTGRARVQRIGHIDHLQAGLVVGDEGKIPGHRHAKGLAGRVPAGNVGRILGIADVNDRQTGMAISHKRVVPRQSYTVREIPGVHASDNLGVGRITDIDHLQSANCSRPRKRDCPRRPDRRSGRASCNRRQRRD